MLNGSTGSRSSAKKLLTLETYCAITFPSTHSALQAEKELQGVSALPFLIMPVPGTISSGCGLAIKVFPADYSKAVGILEEAGITISGVYNLDKPSGTINKII